MAWFSSGFTNLKEQLNSLINDDDDAGNNSSSHADSIPTDTDGKGDTLLPSLKNYAETSEQDEISRRSRASLAQRRLVLQYSKILNDLTSDVNVLNTSLDQVLGDVFECIDENERLREEIKIRKDCDTENENTPFDKIKTDGVAEVTKQDRGDFRDNIGYGPKTAEKGCNTVTMDSSTVNIGDDGETTQQIENLMIEMDEINEKLNQSEKEWRKTTDDGRSHITIETNTLADYATLAHEREVLWDKLKVSFIWPTIARFKNAKISELSVPDSIKEVFQPAPGSRSNDNAVGQIVQGGETVVQCEEKESMSETQHLSCIENCPSTTTATTTGTEKSEKIIDTESNESPPAEDTAVAEINRLRNHLVAVEQAYTNELLQCEEEIKILRSELKSKEEKLNSIAATYTATNLSTNKTLERLQIEIQQLSTDNQQLTTQLSRCRKDLEESQVDNRNLRSALDFFRKDKDSEIYQVTEKLKSEIRVLQSDKERLRESLASIRNDIENSQEIFKKNETLNAELKTKQDEIEALRLKLDELRGQHFQNTNTNTIEGGERTSKMGTIASTLDVEAKMRLNLIKNVAFRYLISDSPNTKAQSLRILADVLEFSDCEKTKIGIKAAVRPGEKTKNDQSLIDEFIRFVEKESQHPKTIQSGGQAQHPAQMQQRLHSGGAASSSDLSPTSTDRDAVISTNTSMNLPPTRNLTSSSILLKDALNSKDI